jgi:K(+)-stimulated pyrophosphate-energized sodium pump
MDNDEESRSVLLGLMLGVALVVGACVAFGASQALGMRTVLSLPVAPSAPSARPAISERTVPVEVSLRETLAAAELVHDEGASVVVDEGVVKFYFEPGQWSMAPGAAVALGSSVAAVNAGKTLVVSGYHDASGDPQRNAALALRRAHAVSDVLQAMGIEQGRVLVQTPQVILGTGSAAEARRVEVRVQP